MADVNTIGPMQVIAVAFDEPDFTGQIANELKQLRDKNFIKIVDGVMVQKDESGNVMVVEKSDLLPGEAAKYGAVIGALIGIGSGSEEVAMESSKMMAEKFHERYEYGLDKEDLEAMTENIPKGGAAIILLLEHIWAIPLRNAFREAGGTLIAQDFLSPELLMSLGQTIFEEE